MLETMDVPSQPNFTMLNEHLHNLFRIYIINGRTRAPPESELVDMVPTFQQGAKTNRRALQSKFKSWAKRMEVENGELVLACSGKVIVPVEKCDELIMNLHSNDHQPIDMVIFEIQKKYSWKKKNFGMDTEIVVKAISAHCTKKECRMYIANSFSRSHLASMRGQSRFFPLSPFPMMFTSSKCKGWPVHLSSSKYFKQKQATFPLSFNNPATTQLTLMNPEYNSLNWSSYGAIDSVPHYLKYSTDVERTVGNYKQNQHFRESQSNVSDLVGEIRNTVSTYTLQKKNNFLQSLELSRKSDVARHKRGSTSGIGRNALEETAYSGKRPTLIRSCKKIKSIFEFRKLLKIAESQPKSYPAVLVNPKTVFLAGLGLTPKRICSKKMLSKFNLELRKKQDMEKRSWFKGHKVLRDRNKLVMNKSQREKSERFSYLSMSHKSPHRFNVSPEVRSKNTKRIENINQSIAIKNIRFTGTQLTNKTQDDGITCFEKYEQDGRNVKLFNVRKDVSKSLSGPKMNISEVIKKLKDSKVSEEFQIPKPKEHEDILKGPSQKDINDSARNIDFKETTSSSALPNSNSSHKYNAPYLFNNSSQLLVPFMVPLLVPVSSAGSNVAFMPHSNFPMFVRPLNPPPLTKTNSQKITPPAQKNITTQSLPRLNTPPLILVGNRTNLNGNIIPKSLKQLNPSRNTEVLITNKAEKDGNVLFKPYRVLAPKKEVSSNGLKTPTLAPRTKQLKNILPINIVSRIESKKTNPLQKKTNSDLTRIDESYIDYLGSKDVGMEMKKLSDWIGKMTKTVIPSTFGKEIEKYRLYLSAELDAGIDLVKEIRSALINIEKNNNKNA